MKIEIDQSEKVEQTSLDTVIAFSNGLSFSVFIKKSEKRIIKHTFRHLKLLKVFRQLVFSVLIAIGIYKSKTTNTILIDTEYAGYNEFIRSNIGIYLKKLGVSNIPAIRFGFVGKESKSHYLAQAVLRKKRKPDFLVTADEIFKLILLPNKKSGTA